jgi:hypothetical protein
MAIFPESLTKVIQDREDQYRDFLIHIGQDITMIYICGAILGNIDPILNAPAVDWTEYDSYDPLDGGHIPTHHPRLPHELDNSSHAMPIPLSLPGDDLTQTGQFLMAMGRRDEIELAPPEGPRFNINEQNLSTPIPLESQLPVEDRSIDELPSLEVLKDAFLTLVDALPEDYPDLVNVRRAMRKVRDRHIALSEMNEAETQSDPLQFDPYEEAEQFFNQQMELLEKSFDDPAITDIEAQDVFEGQAGESGALFHGHHLNESFSEQDSLEQIVSQDPFRAPLPEFAQDDMIPNEVLPNSAFMEGHTLDDNCDGRLLKDLLIRYQVKCLDDPMQGSGTSRDVVEGLNKYKKTGIRYWGGDLREGFDLTKEDLPGKFDFVWIHPPYWNIIRYRDNNPNDLSNCESYEELRKLLMVCLKRCYGALELGGRLAVLIGDVRRAGKYTPIVKDVLNLRSVKYAAS